MTPGETCPTCGHVKRRGRQAGEGHRRLVVCRWCGDQVVQFGPGRPWKTCRAPSCIRKQITWRRNGGACLERL